MTHYNYEGYPICKLIEERAIITLELSDVTCENCQVELGLLDSQHCNLSLENDFTMSKDFQEFEEMRNDIVLKNIYMIGTDTRDIYHGGYVSDIEDLEKLTKKLLKDFYGECIIKNFKIDLDKEEIYFDFDEFSDNDFEKKTLYIHVFKKFNDE